MKVLETSLPGVLVVEPEVFGDERGFFMETYQAERYARAGIHGPFLQDNYSRSVRGTLRGLHFQEPRAQGKVVSVARGAVFDVVVDIRRGSPTFGRWFSVLLSEQNKRQLWVPPGLAHGFCVMSDVADMVYKCTELYAPEHEMSILWNDPDLGIEWPVSEPLLAAKDIKAPRLRDAPLLPVYRPA